MKKIKILISIIACMIFALGLTACGSNASDERAGNSVQTVDDTAEKNDDSVTDVTEQDKTETEASKEDITEADTNTDETAEQAQTGSGKDTLVVYFSATGTTKGVAEKIAAITDADIYEIVPAEPYSDADLDWHDKDSRSTKEQNDTSARPAIGSEKISLEGYKTIYIGYPIWWGEEPRIMDTFVESYNFDGITVIPFCTSGGSGIGRSGNNLAENAGSGNWLDGDRLQGDISEDDLKGWLDEFK